MRTLVLGILLMAFILLAPEASQGRQPVRAGSERLRVIIENKGTLEISLFPDRAPQTCKRILDLAKSGFYDGQRFHKVVKSPKPFLVQIGDPNSKTKSPDDPSLGNYRSGVKVPYENSGVGHVKGAVGLARLEDDKNSGDSQFYIMLEKYSFLDGQYTVFGMVTSGNNLLDRIDLGDRVTKVTVVSQ